MFTTNLFACYRHLALRSRAMDVELKIPCSIAYVCTHAKCSNRWRSCVSNLRGGPWRPNPCHTFDVPKTATRLPSITAPRRYVMITKPCSASLRLAIISTKPSRIAIHENLDPRKFSAIRYIFDMLNSHDWPLSTIVFSCSTADIRERFYLHTFNNKLSGESTSDYIILSESYCKNIGTSTIFQLHASS